MWSFRFSGLAAGIAEFLQQPVAEERTAAQHDRDEEIATIAAIQNGDRAPFRLLVERYHRRVHALVYRLVRNPADADDLAQQAFVNAFDAIDDFRLDMRFSAWLYRIAINLAKDHLKSKKRGEEQLGDSDEGVAADSALFCGRVPSPDAAPEAAERCRLLHTALESLSGADRTVLVLKDIEELPYEEIRQIVGSPVTALKIRVVRARARLRRALEEQAGEGAL